MVEAQEQPAGDEAPRRRSSVFEMFQLPEIQMPEINHTANKNRKLHQYQTVNNRPRWLLHLQAEIWRFLMGIGMFLHRLAPPRPPKPNFYRTIDSTIASIPGQITLHFYVPSDFNSQKRIWTSRPELFDDEEADGAPADRGSAIRKSIGSISGAIRRASSRGRRWGGYPVVVNFHGGGFTLGSPYDDARWCGTVVQQLNAIVVSVDYRLAPEHPFPTAVEDGVDAVIWLHKHADEFGIDTDKIILSGFSSGANMAFTVPLRLYDEQTGFRREDGDVVKEGANAGKVLDTVQEDGEIPQNDGAHTAASPASRSGSSSSTKIPPKGDVLEPVKAPPALPRNSSKQPSTVHAEAISELPEIRIRCIVPWYPSLDYTRTREERRATCVRADQELPSLFTNLFDDSYLHPPKDVSLDSPYLSPGVAATDLLRNALPSEIIMHTCEWDMLLDEGQAFYQRLTSKEIGKHVNYTMVPGVPHGWDKAPNPLKPTPGVKEHYLKACKAMKAVLGQRDGGDPNEGPAGLEHRPSMVR